MFLTLLAEAAPAAAPPVTDWLVALIVAVTPVVVGILSWAMKTYGHLIPSWLKPILATGLGAALAYLSGVVTANPILIAVIGMATIGLREIINQLGQALGLFQKKP